MISTKQEIELEVVENETEETETKRKSRNIIIHGAEELMDAYQKELENEDHKCVENVIMKPIKFNIETNTTPSN